LEDTNRLLEQIVDKISTVSRELSGIKMALEQGSFGGAGGRAPGTRRHRTAPVIPLDFEGFLAEQNAEEKKENIE
jgi:methyl coenzyme M reductase beta subunit